MSVNDLIIMVFKHKCKIMLMFFAVTVVVAGGTLISKPVYLAKSSFLIKPWKEDSARPGMDASNTNMNLVLSQDELVNTEIQILTGRDLAEKVIIAMKPEKMYPGLLTRGEERASLDAAVETFGKNLTATGIRKSNVVEVSFQHRDPKIAAAALNLLIDAFKEKHLALHSAPQSSFIETQLASFENKLKESERSLQAFQQANGVYSLEEQRSLLLKQRADLDSAYMQAHNSTSELGNKISALKAQLVAMSKSNARYTPTERDKIITDARTKQLELQLKVQELRRKYSDNNRLVVEAKKEVDVVSKFLKEQEEGISGKVKTGNPVYQSIEIDLFRAQGELDSQIARAGSLRGQLKQLDREIAQLDSTSEKVQNLKREISINEKNYKTYADRQEEARISEAMNRLKLSNISVIQLAEVPAKPVNSNKILKILGGALLGMLSGLACAYLSESTRQTFSDPESVEKYLGVPVVLTIPYKED